MSGDRNDHDHLSNPHLCDPSCKKVNMLEYVLNCMVKKEYIFGFEQWIRLYLLEGDKCFCVEFFSSAPTSWRMLNPYLVCRWIEKEGNSIRLITCPGMEILISPYRFRLICSPKLRNWNRLLALLCLSQTCSWSGRTTFVYYVRKITLIVIINIHRFCFGLFANW